LTQSSTDSGSRSADSGFAQLAMQRRRPALDLQPARQNAFVATTGGDAVLHHLPDFQQTGAGFGSGRQALSLVSITWLIDSRRRNDRASPWRF
jgi:hypothetical protein